MLTKSREEKFLKSKQQLAMILKRRAITRSGLKGARLRRRPSRVRVCERRSAQGNLWITARGQSTKKDPHNFGVEPIRTFASFIVKQVNLNTTQSERIFINRTNKNRIFKNHDEVISILSHEYNFQIFSPGHMTFNEQVAIFYNAKCIVGQSGAEWSNIIYCNRKSSVKAICICDEAYKNHWNLLSETANVDLNYLYTETIYDTILDIRLMKSMLDSLL